MDVDACNEIDSAGRLQSLVEKYTEIHDYLDALLKIAQRKDLVELTAADIYDRTTSANFMNAVSGQMDVSHTGPNSTGTGVLIEALVNMTILDDPLRNVLERRDDGKRMLVKLVMDTATKACEKLMRVCIEEDELAILRPIRLQLERLERRARQERKTLSAGRG